jgi:hypothetical protein
MKTPLDAVCSVCGSGWRGTKANHCTLCHRTFTTERNGDRHRVGDFDPPSRRCLTDAELVELGLERKERDGWGAWGARAPLPTAAVGHAAPPPHWVV